MTRWMDLFDSRKNCPQCSSDQLEYRTPQNTQGKSGRIIGATFMAFPLALAMILKLNLMGLLVIWMIFCAGLVLILALTDRRKVYRMKCQQCGHQWAMTKEEWLQTGDTPVQTKILSPQEKREKRAAVESLINQIKKM